MSNYGEAFSDLSVQIDRYLTDTMSKFRIKWGQNGTKWGKMGRTPENINEQRTPPPFLPHLTNHTLHSECIYDDSYLFVFRKTNETLYRTVISGNFVVELFGNPFLYKYIRDTLN